MTEGKNSFKKKCSSSILKKLAKNISETNTNHQQQVFHLSVINFVLS